MSHVPIPAAALAFLLAACTDGGGSGEGKQAEDGPPSATPGSAKEDPAPAAVEAARPEWGLQSSGEGVALVYPASGAAAVRLWCSAGGRELLVNIPAFRPVASEERLSFGGGGEVVALVADTRGDRQRGGVSGTGAVPANLADLVRGPIAVNYGSQNSGPHPAPAPELAGNFVAACRQDAAPTPGPQPPPQPVSPCLIQGGERLSNPPLRAVGTEPFWGARIEGRCVTYSHPDDQAGTRVWARYVPGSGGGGTWSGRLGNRPFELVVRPQPGCSDGMSDRRYPYAAELTVHGERRRGCAQPADARGDQAGSP